MKNKLTLKALKLELENLKKANSTIKAGKPSSTDNHTSTLGHDIKNSYINNLHMKSSFIFWWILSWFIYFSKKLPIINKLAGLLTLYYGRTTMWKVLVKIRKVFVVFNAIIGMYMVYKTTGFNFDNILAGFSGLGHTYLEIFINFNKRLFNWLIELFDYKLIPNLPNTPPNHPKPSNTSWSNSIPTLKSLEDKFEPIFSLRELYKNASIIESRPWYKDLTSWLWIGGSLVTVGAMFIGYKFIMDPLFIEDWLPFLRKPRINIDPPADQVGVNNVEVAEIALEDLKGKASGFWRLVIKPVKLLNPYNWFLTSSNHEANVEAFMAVQTSANYDGNYYPFTEIDPNYNWFKRMRISWLGETTRELKSRTQFRESIMDNIFFETRRASVIESGSGTLTPVLPEIANPFTATWPVPKSPASLGLGLNLTAHDTLPEFVQGSSNVVSKIASLPVTPAKLPVVLPDSMIHENPFEKLGLKNI
jgi:hypothetical protein